MRWKRRISLSNDLSWDADRERERERGREEKRERSERVSERWRCESRGRTGCGTSGEIMTLSEGVLPDNRKHGGTTTWSNLQPSDITQKRTR